MAQPSYTVDDAVSALNRATEAVARAVDQRRHAHEVEAAARERHDRLNSLVTFLTACSENGDLR